MILKTTVLIVVFSVALAIVSCDETTKKVGVVYFLENVQENRKNPFEDSKVATRKNGNVYLGEAIQEDEALPDGVYFRPAGGKPLEKGTVSHFPCYFLKQTHLTIFCSKFSFLRKHSMCFLIFQFSLKY